MKARGDLIRVKRFEIGLTQAELAHASGVSRNVIASLESGRRGTSAANLRKLATALKLKFEEVVVAP